MTRLILFSALLILASCNRSTEQSNDIDAIIAQIANDSIYIEYSQVVIDHQNNIIASNYDLPGIRQVILEKGANYNCEVVSPELSALKGGEIYQNSLCHQGKLMKRLMTKYPDIFSGPSTDPATIERLQNYYLSHSASFRGEREKSNQLFIDKRLHK